MRKIIYIKTCLFLFILFFILSIFFYSFSSCTANTKNNNIENISNLTSEKKVNSSNFIYLIQDENMTPIYYPVNDYLIKSFDRNIIKKDIKFDFEKSKPSFLQDVDISFFDRCDSFLDFKLYTETIQYFSYLIEGKDFNIILNYLKKYIDEQPPKPYEIEVGDILNVYQNGIEYRYPLEKGATIIEFVDKSYQIKFSDGRIFYLLSNGIYFETYEDGSEIYYVNPAINYFRRWFGSILFVKTEKFIEIQVGTSNISLYYSKPRIIKYCYPKNYELYLYLNDSLDFPQLSNMDISKIDKLLFKVLEDYFITLDNITKSIYFNIKDYLVSIQSNLIKTIYMISNNSENTFFNKKIISVFLPEGIKLTDFDSQYSKSEVNFTYNYKKTLINQFCFYYSDEISSFLSRIKKEKLDEILSIISKELNWQISQPINVILPKDIYEYQSLLSGEIQREFSNLPDGFTRDDIIISWPVNLPRYYEDKDMNYFYEKEFYSILLFQLVRKISLQQVAFFSRLPYFIQVGLPIYITSLYDEQLKNSYENLFHILYKNNFSFDKSLLIITNSESTQVVTNRYLAAFSYRLIKYIFSIYEHNKITDFIRTFKIDINKKNFLLNQSNQDFLDFSNKNINKIFGVSLDKLIEAACLKTSSF